MKHFKKINQLLRSLAMLLCIVLLLPILPVLPGSAEDPSLAAEGSAEGEVTVVCEDESKRTAFEKHYLLSDGTYYAVSYAEAVHEQDEQGKWVDAHSEPVYDEDEDAYLVKGKGYRASFGLSQNKAALINKKGQALCWHYELIGYEDEKAVMKLEKKNAKAQGGKNASPKGKKVGDKDAFALPEAQGELLFEDAFSALGAEVRYTVSPQKIKEDVILNEKGRVYALSMVIENCGYKARLEDGAVIFEDNKGNDYFYVDAPLMYDAAGESSTAVQVLLKQTGKTVTVTYTPDKAWLDAPERVYPVTFDPAVTTEDYAANMEDYCTATTGSGPVECTTGNYAGVSGSTTYATYLRINNLPDTQGLPLLKANLHVTFSSVSSGLAGAELVLGTIDHDGAFSGLLNYLYPTSTEVDSDVMMGASYSDFNLTNSALLEAMANEEGICYQLAFSGTVYDRLQIHGLEHASAPVASFYYGYVAPVFTGNQVFLNDLQSSLNRQILKMNGTNLSMTAYNAYEARGSMILQESSNGVVIKANYEGNYLDAANGNGGYPVAGSIVSGSSTGDDWVVLQTASTHYLILLASNPGLALTRASSGIILQEVQESMEDSQLWKITNIGSAVQADGRTVAEGVYYINNLASRTFMTMHAPTDAAPTMKSGTESALGNRMAWYVQFVGGGQYTIESVYAPGHYLTADDSSVAIEDLSDYEDIPIKAIFALTYTSGKLTIKSNYGRYVGVSSSTSSTLSPFSSTTDDRTKWRVSLKNQYDELSDFSVDDIHLLLQENTTLSIGGVDSDADFANLQADFRCVAPVDDIYYISGLTVTARTTADVATVTVMHIPTGVTSTCIGWFGDGIFQLGASSKVLNATSSSSIGLANPVVASNANFGKQLWYTEFAEMENNVAYYYIHSLGIRDSNYTDNNVLTCSSSGKLSLSLRSDTKTTQLWQFAKQTSGGYRVINKSTGRSLNISENKLVASAQQTTAWTFEDMFELDLPSCSWSGTYANMTEPFYINIAIDESAALDPSIQEAISNDSNVWNVWNNISSNITVNNPYNAYTQDGFWILICSGNVDHSYNAIAQTIPLDSERNIISVNSNFSACIIEIDPWFTKDLTEISIKKVIAHEIGHALKLSHKHGDETTAPFSRYGQGPTTESPSTNVLSIMNQGILESNSSATIEPTFLDKFDLIMKWGI